MGAGMRYFDVGGGLAIDYDGSFTDTTASMSYTLQNYANDVIGAMQARRGPVSFSSFLPWQAACCSFRLGYCEPMPGADPALLPPPAPAGGVHPARHRGAHHHERERPRAGLPPHRAGL